MMWPDSLRAVCRCMWQQRNHWILQLEGFRRPLVRFGVCADVTAAKMLANCGYDYIELAAAADLVPEQGEAEWAAKRCEIDVMPIRPEAFNSFVRTGKIVGPEAEPERLPK